MAWLNRGNQGMIEETVKRVESGVDLSLERMADTMRLVMQGKCEDSLVARLLLALRKKGETGPELAGAAIALRENMTPIHTNRDDVLDTCGTGGDGSQTFNISTAAALVAAAAGVAVAKHGNSGATSRSGSADALASLGVNIHADVACIEACLEELGICFCFAPLLHPAMKYVAHLRKKLGVPTIFNMLGPLSNPARASIQLLGVNKERFLPLMAETLRLLGSRRGVVVLGADGLDEVTLADTTDVAEATAKGIRRFLWTPGDFGLETTDLDELRVDGPQASAALIRRVLGGESGVARDIVVANAAAALWAAGKGPSVLQCARLAETVLDNGAASALLARLAERTQAVAK